ncbi:hypothetical protein ACFYST_04855 [Kitasatospora sp. NPDC004614]|uniref:hypothetical protein n=1 Tax=unclassified Kitasatospora TaxID=2633591 RepID=UPI0036B8C09C
MPPTPDALAAPFVGPDRGRADACPGALRLHPAEDGQLARLRLPGGYLTYHQLLALADAADALGDGEVEITSRGNLQLRGLREQCATDLAERLRSVGLLPSDTHERVRNIAASPLAGLDGRGAPGVDLPYWVRELDAALCAAPWAARLSGKFLFALDDGRGDTAALDADVTLIAIGDGRALLRLGRADHASTVDHPVPAALDAARHFLDLAAGRAWHLREVQSELPAGDVPLPRFTGERPVLGAIPGGGGGGDGGGGGGGRGGGVSVGLRFGRATSAQWRLLADALASAGEGCDGASGGGGASVRLTPWRGVVVPGAGADWLPRLADAGFRVESGGPWEGVSACTGLPGCGKALADVRAQAVRAIAAVPAVGLPVHWSGCERRCGHPAGRWVDVLATATGYRVAVDGRAREVGRGAGGGGAEIVRAGIGSGGRGVAGGGAEENIYAEIIRAGINSAGCNTGDKNSTKNDITGQNGTGQNGTGCNGTGRNSAENRSAENRSAENHSAENDSTERNSAENDIAEAVAEARNAEWRRTE